MATTRENGGDTASEILDIAEALVQRRGFNGFSYADVARALGVTKPALHYHFATKTELGERLIARYSARFDDALAAIDEAALTEAERLLAYCDLYRTTLRDERFCLCGMLAAEFNTLAPTMREGLERFFDRNRSWLADLLERGRQTGGVQLDEPAERAAQTVIAALEGAMLLARPYGDAAVLDGVIARLLADFVGSSEVAP